MLSSSRSVGCVLKGMSMICLLTMATVSHADVGKDQMNLKGRSLATPEPPVPKKPPHHEKIPTPPLPKGHPHPPPEKALLPEPPKLPEAFEHMKPRPLGGAPPGPPHPPVHEDPEIHEPPKPSGSADEPTAEEPSTESTTEDQGKIFHIVQTVSDAIYGNRFVIDFIVLLYIHLHFTITKVYGNWVSL